MNELNTRIANLTPAQRAVLHQRLQEKRPGIGSNTAIARRGEVSRAPLSFAQERIWFLDQFETNKSVYNIPLGLRLQGILDVEVLKQSLNEMVRRHEALRTRFETIDNQPVQIVEPAASLEMPITDLSELPREQRESEAARLCRDEARRPFDLKHDLMLRVRLFRFDATDHLLLLNMHHIASDGWSMGVIYRELRTLYSAFVTGRPSPLPEPPVQYADYAVWQRQWLQGEVLEKQLNYWRKQLEGVPERLELPTDRPRPAIQSYHGAMRRENLSGELTTALKKLSRAEHATLFMTLLAAFQSLLHRYTAMDDIVIGTVVAGRNRTEIESLVGFFVNTLALRGDLSGNPTFRELLHRSGETALAAFAHQDVPFEKLVEVLKPKRDTSHAPLFQVLLVLQNASSETAQLPNLEVTTALIHTETSKFDLTLSFKEIGGSLEMEFEYNADLFEPATISRMLGHLRTLLEGIVAAPETRLSDLPILTEAERRQLLVEWNQTGRDYPRDKCIHELFEEQVARSPEATAVVFAGDSLSYGELNRRAERVADHLRALGVEPGALAGLLIERSFEMIIGLLGILKAGAAYWALEDNLPKERLRIMLAHARPRVLLVRKKSAGPPPDLSDLPEAERPSLVAIEDLLETSPPEAKSASTRPTAGDPAYVSYTSGSTGLPKGVVVPHRGVVRLVKSTDYAAFGPDEIFLHLSPVSFDASTFELWGALLNGGRAVVMAPGTPTLAEMGAAIRTQGVTTAWLTAGLFHLMVEERLDDLKPLQQLLAGGDVLSPEHVRKARRSLPDCRIINGYGPTENTTFTCCYQVENERDLSPSVPIGRPIANTQVYILDESRRPVPVGVAGELYAGGDGVACGYLHQPELTAQKFVADPFSGRAGSRLYRTGDRARWRPDGNIEYLGRIDHQVKIRGFRVELEEIEEALNRHPGVKTSVVAAREDTPGDKRLIAYLVSRNGPLSPSAMRESLRGRLPDYMVPTAFVTLEALPLTPHGKINRRALPPPDAAAMADENHFVAPRTPTEITLARIWMELLGLKQMGIHDSFFDLGGHSLLAVRLFSEIRKQFKVDLQLSALFEARTIGALAKFIDEIEEADSHRNQSAAGHRLITIRPGKSSAVLFMVHSGDGNVLCYESLARHLPADQAICGLESRGLSGLPLDYRVESVARDFIEQIRERQPHGPYFILGHCFGGTVAYEMARQLAARNEEMALVGLLETFNPNLLKADPMLEATFQKSDRIRLIKRIVRDIQSLALGPDRRGCLRKIMASAQTRWVRGFYLVTFKLCTRFGWKMPSFLRNVQESIRIASNHYVPKPFAGRIVFFRCRHPLETDPPDASHLWQNLVKEGVVVDVPGDHNSMLKEPGAQILAERIAELMR